MKVNIKLKFFSRETYKVTIIIHGNLAAIKL